MTRLTSAMFVTIGITAMAHSLAAFAAVAVILAVCIAFELNARTL